MSNKKPIILILAGPNGSGKSTITQYLEKVGTYTNADDIVSSTGMNNEDAAKFADDNTIEPVRIVCKHKEDISIFPNDLWSEDEIMSLIE